MDISKMTMKEVIDFVASHWEDFNNDNKNTISKMFTDDFNREEFCNILNKCLQ